MYEGRLIAINRLAELGTQATAAVPVLASLIEDPIEPFRFKLAEVKALERIGAGAKSSTPTLLRVAKANPKLRRAAKIALVTIETLSRRSGFKSTAKHLVVPTEIEPDTAQPILSLTGTSTMTSAKAKFSPCSRFITYWAEKTSSGFLSSHAKSINPRVIEIATGKECAGVEGEFDFMNVVFSRDGTRVCFCNGRSVSVLSTESSERLAKLDSVPAKIVSFLRDGEVLLAMDLPDWKTPAKPASIRLWDTRDWSELPNGLPAFRAFSPPHVTSDGELVAAVVIKDESRQSEFKIWEIESGRELEVPAIENPMAVIAADSPRTMRILANGIWQTWDMSTWQLLHQGTSLPADRRLPAQHDVNGIARDSLNVRLIDERWEVTNIFTGDKVNTFPNQSNWKGESGDYKSLVGDHWMLLRRKQLMGELNFWDLERPDDPLRRRFEWPIEQLALSQNDLWLAFVQSKQNLGGAFRQTNELAEHPPKRLSVMNLDGMEQPTPLLRGVVNDIRFANQSEQLAVVMSERVELWDVSAQKIKDVFRPDGDGPCHTVCFSPDDQRLAIASGSSIELRSVSGDQVQWQMDLGPVTKLKASPDGRVLAASTIDGYNREKVWLLSMKDGKLLRQGNSDHRVDLFHFWSERQLLSLVRQEDRISQLDLSADSTIPAVEAYQPTDRKQDSLNRNAPFSRQAHSYAASRTNGLYAVAGAFEGYSEQAGEIRVRDLLNGNLQTVLSAKTGRINTASFYSNGRRIVAGGRSRIEHELAIVDLNRGKITGTIRGQLLVTATEDGSLLLTRDPIARHRLSLWDTQGRKLASFAHRGLRSGQFSPDGNTLITTSGDIKVWNVRQLLEAGKAR